MAFPLLWVAIGTAVGVKGPAIVRKVRSMVGLDKGPPPPSALGDMPIAMQKDVLHILSNVTDTVALQQALRFYQGFPQAADLISQKLRSLTPEG